MAARIVKLNPHPLSGYLADWEASAQRAMLAEPAYFARWYTVKSIALALSLGVVGYLITKK